MLERPPDITKITGLCPHENSSDSCPECQKVKCDDIILPKNELSQVFPEILATSFAEARARTKKISPNVVLGLLNGDLVGVDGKVYFFKNYLDLVMPDDLERHARQTPEVLGQMHKEAMQMIIDNLSVGVTGLTEQEKTHITQRKAEYIDRLKQDSDTWVELVKQIATSKQISDNFTSTAEYRGFIITTNSGEMDISEFTGNKMPNVRPNIRMQREITELFIHWETDKFNTSKLEGQEVKLSKRIYLNPKTINAVQIFTKLMHSLNEAGIFAQGKVLDRSYELAGQMLASSAKPIRADAIVLVVDESEADRVLEMTLSLYTENPDVFTGRPTPKIPTRIAEGIAVGDEPRAEGKSLTAHRAEVIQEAIMETKANLGLESWEKIPKDEVKAAMDTFQAVFLEVTKKHKVDQNNLAFNLPE